MEINRFWGNTPVAHYTPTSMQEAAFIPQQMYQREQELTNKVDAMNEANATLKAMLGDKAGKTEEFNAGLKDITDKISREGATQRNIDLAKNLRQSYLKEVLPQEAFAKKREQLGAGYMKDVANTNNIIVGNNPLNVSFDQAQKDPNAMQYQVAERDKLLQHGALIGKQYAESEMSQQPDDWGFLVTKKGFGTAEEAMKTYQTDPKFKQWVDDQAVLATKARGLSNPNEQALDAIKSGIMSTVVGGTERNPLPAGYYKNIKTGDNAGVVTMEKEVTATSAPKDFNQLIAIPEVKQEVNKEVSRQSGGKYKSLEELDTAINSKSNIEENKAKILDQYLKAGTNPTAAAYAVQSMEAPELQNFNKTVREAKEIRSNIEKNTVGSSAFAQDMRYKPNYTVIGALPKEFQNTIKDVEDGISTDMTQQFVNLADSKSTKYGGVTKDDKDLIKQFIELKDPNKKVKLQEVRVNAVPIGDNKEVGSGEPTITFNLIGKDSKNKDFGDKGTPTVTVRLPRHLTDKVFTLVDLLSNTHPATKVTAQKFHQVYNNYYDNQEKNNPQAR